MPANRVLRLPCRLPRWTYWFIALPLGVSVLVLHPHAAWADGQSPPPVVWSWMDIKDTTGTSIWAYSLSMNHGGWTNGTTALSWWFTDLIWEVYRGFVAFALWAIDWVISLTWLKTISTPLIGVGSQLHAMLFTNIRTTALLSITGLVAGFALMRGKLATGAYEAFASAVVAALAITMLANPVASVGGDAGWLVKSRDGAVEAAGQLTNTPDAQHAATERMATALVRYPQQLVNFGQIVENGKCAGTYKTFITSDDDGTPPSQTDDGYKSFEGCSQKAYDSADNTGIGTVITASVLSWGGFFILAFAILFALIMVGVAVWALWSGLRTTWNGAVGLLPGRARAPLAQSVADMFVGCAQMIGVIIFLFVYMLVVGDIMLAGGTSTANVMVKFLTVDFLTLIAIVLIVVLVIKMHKASKKVADGLLKRPGPAPVSSPKHPNPIASAAKWQLGTKAAQLGLHAGAAALTGGSSLALQSGIGASVLAGRALTGVGNASGPMMAAAGRAATGATSAATGGAAAAAAATAQWWKNRRSGPSTKPAGTAVVPRAGAAAPSRRSFADTRGLPPVPSKPASHGGPTGSKPSGPRRPSGPSDGPKSRRPRGRTTRSSTTGPAARPSLDRFDKVIVDGQVVFVPKKQDGDEGAAAA